MKKERRLKIKLTKNPPNRGLCTMASHWSNIFASSSSKFSYFHPSNIATIPPCWFELEKPGAHKSGN